MNGTKYFGAALIVLAVLAVPALAAHVDMGLLLTGALAFGVMGTTVTYLYPVANTTTAPTAIQSSQAPTVVAQVVFVDADTTAAITHNFGIATAAGFAGIQPNIGQGFPEVIPSWIATSTVVATIGYTNTSGNVVTLTKASLLGTAGTLFVTIRKPHTLSL